jgi:chromosome segregation ATPase
VQNERDLWEQKFEQKRKALKEVEQQLNRENAELEKKVCLLQENLTRLDAEKRRQEAEYQERIAEAEAQINQLDSSAGEAFYFGNAQAESVMQLKTNMQEYERQLSDLQSMYDKDKALWEGKCKFLENQKENYKKDLVESQRKFEITLE